MKLLLPLLLVSLCLCLTLAKPKSGKKQGGSSDEEDLGKKSAKPGKQSDLKKVSKSGANKKVDENDKGGAKRDEVKQKSKRSKTKSSQIAASTPTTTVEESTTDNSQDEQTEPSTSAPFVCPKANGLFVDKENCRYFYHCSNRIKYRVLCPAELFFNHKLEQCDWPENIKRLECKVNGEEAAEEAGDEEDEEEKKKKKEDNKEDDDDAADDGNESVNEANDGKGSLEEAAKTVADGGEEMAERDDLDEGDDSDKD